MQHDTGPKYEQAKERMEGVPTEDLCRFALTAIWREPAHNAAGVNGEALHAHAIESLVYRIRTRNLEKPH